MASPKSHMVSELLLCSLAARGPFPATRVTQKAVTGNRKAWDSCDKPLAFIRSDPKEVACLTPAFKLSFAIWRFFFPSEICLNILFDLISSTEKCCPEGPAEVLSGPASLKKASSCLNTKNGKSVSRLPRLMNTFFPKWIHSFQQGLFSLGGKAKLSIVQPLDFKSPPVFTLCLEFSLPGLSLIHKMWPQGHLH